MNKKRFLKPLPDMELRIAGTVSESIVDGPGMRFVVFTQGCPHNCAGCHNPHTHDPVGGSIITIKELYGKFKDGSHDGITFSGGEPFMQPAPLSYLAERLAGEGFSVMTYSGYTIEQLMDTAEENPDVKRLLKNTNILVDGPFVQSKKDLLLMYRGSSNQNVWDITCYPNTKDFTKMY